MTRPQVAPPRPWRFPPHEETTLPNGLRVWHFHLPGQHMSTFQVLLPVSLTAEPRDREGVGAVALHAIDEGTRSHPDGAIGELLERNGAALHGSARQRYTTLGGQAPARRLKEVLPLFVEVLTEPAYSPADVDLHVESASAEHRSRLASPGHANRLALAAALFGDHRSSRPAAGTPETLRRITVDDVHAWHRAHFVPGAATAIIAGAGSLDDALGPLSQWEAGAGRAAPHLRADSIPARSVVVDHPEAVQTALALAGRTITRDDDAWPALRVAAHAMVGAFASRLNLEVRERLGYTYGVGGGVMPGVSEGQFMLSAAVRGEVTGDALARILDGLALREPFSAKEIADARTYLLGAAPLSNETSEDIVSQATALAAAELTPQYLEQHLARVADVTPAQATDTFRRLVHPAGLALAATGVAADLVGALAAAGRPAEVVTLA